MFTLTRVQDLLDMTDSEYEMPGDVPGQKRGKIPTLSDLGEVIELHEQFLMVQDDAAPIAASIVNRVYNTWRRALKLKDQQIDWDDFLVAANRSVVAVIDALRITDSKLEQSRMFDRASGWAAHARMTLRDVA